MLYSYFSFPELEKDKDTHVWRENLLEVYQLDMGFSV